MAGNAHGKLRTLYIMRMLRDETDAQHGLSMSRIIEKLNALGITVDRKTVYNDFKVLREFGFVIKKHQRNPVEYSMGQRELSLDDLITLADAVQASPFITQRQADSLLRSLKQLASEPQRKSIHRRIHVSHRVNAKSESAFGPVDEIFKAVSAHCKLSFLYAEKPGADAQEFTLSPIRVEFEHGAFALLAWDDAAEQALRFDVANMEDIRVSDEKATPRTRMKGYEDLAEE